MSLNKTELNELLEFALKIATGAGEIQLREYGKDPLITIKKDNTVQTKADRLSSSYLLGKIRTHTSDFGILCEETPDNESRFNSEYWWNIDPLDASILHMSRGWNWGPKIALMHQNTPVVSVVYRPMFKTSPRDRGKPEYVFATSKIRTRRQFDGEKSELYASPQQKKFRTAVSPRESDTLDSMLKLLGYRQRKKKKKRLHYSIDEIPIRQRGMKIVEISKGTVDLVLYAPDMPQSLWDVGAEELNLVQSDGTFSDAYGDPINYQKHSATLLEGVIASNGKFDHELFKNKSIL